MNQRRFPGTEPAERAAALMATAGMPRIAARVLMALVGSPDDGYTAAELAERLGVSPAAVSGAVRYLQSVHMVQRTSRPGERRGRYDLVHDGWHSALTANAPLYAKLAHCIDQVADENVGASASVARAREMSAFFRFLTHRMPRLLEEWNELRGDTARLSTAGGSTAAQDTQDAGTAG